MNKNQDGLNTALSFDVEGACWDADNEYWYASENEPKLLIPLTGLKSWLSIEGILNVLEGDHNPRIVFISKGKKSIYPIPVTLKGTIKEVVPVPDDVQQVWFLPLSGHGTFRLTDFAFYSTSGLKAYWRMARRVALFFARQGLPYCKRLGISPLSLVFRLPEAYSRVGQQRALAPALSYEEWLQRFAEIDEFSRHQIITKLTKLQQQYLVSVIVYANSETSPAELSATLSALDNLWGNACLIVLLSNHNVTLELPEWVKWVSADELRRSVVSSSQWCLLVTAGAVVAPEALYGFLVSLFDNPNSSCLYSDHDVLENNTRTRPQFKPEWSIELERSSHYLGQVLLVKAESLLACGWLDDGIIADSYALTLRLAEVLSPADFTHIPLVLWHQNLKHFNKQLPASLLQAHLERLYIKANVAQSDYGTLAVRYSPVLPLPLVSIIVPTRDMLCHLKPCIDSVLQHTDYVNFELLVVDNQSVEAGTKAYLDQISQDPRVSVLHYDRAFNYSAINNFAVSRAKGSLICLLNNDTEVITADWLTVMVGAVQQPNVAVVGAKLFYSDGRVQHAGDVVGPGGCADHLHSRLAGDAPGYMKRAIVPQDLSAVTAACLLTYKAIFEQLGGLNETALKVAFNDVDYCLRVRAAGYRVVFTPYAQLYHHESVSRGVDDSPEKQKRASVEVNYMQQTWQEVIQNDPFYHPNLNYARPDFKLSAAPRAVKLWLK